MPGTPRNRLAAFLCITAAVTAMLSNSGADARTLAAAAAPSNASRPSSSTAAAANASAAGNASAPAACAPPEARQALLRAVQLQLRSLRGEVASFWLEHGLDKEFGGFHATIDRGGVVGKSTDKGIVQQARHTWFFSQAVASRALTGPQATAAEGAAKSAWGFMRDHMAVKTPNGTNWRWLVSRDGSRVVQQGPHLYGQFFAIYGATQYYKAFKDPSALQAALSTFRAADAATHDSSTGGFDETSSRPRLSNDTLPGGGVPRTLNIFLHGTESLAALYEATNDPTVRDRLVELITLIATRLVTPDGGLYEFYDPATWKPAGPPSVNWGHNLESAWLVAVTCDLLKEKGALSPPLADAYTAKLMDVAARAAREGYDSSNGGFYEAGVPGAAPGVGKGASTDKIWWVQCEASLALWQLWRRTGDCTYLNKLQGTVQFIRDHLRDPQDGEWLWSTDATGTRPGYWGYTKGNIWKASYHNGRLLTFLDQWIAGAAGLAPAAGGGAGAPAAVTAAGGGSRNGTISGGGSKAPAATARAARTVAGASVPDSALTLSGQPVAASGGGSNGAGSGTSGPAATARAARAVDASAASDSGGATISGSVAGGGAPVAAAASAPNGSPGGSGCHG